MVFVPLRVESTTVVGRLNPAEELLFSTLNSSMVSRPGGRRKAALRPQRSHQDLLAIVLVE
jgi:hypothetical protein